jgi:hypothetical protein
LNGTLQLIIRLIVNQPLGGVTLPFRTPGSFVCKLNLNGLQVIIWSSTNLETKSLRLLTQQNNIFY